MKLSKNSSGRWIDEHGRFVPSSVAEKILGEQAKLALLEEEAESLISKENEPPEWLKQTLVVIADSFGITPEEFASRVNIIHPTPVDPVITIDGKAVISYI